MNILREAWGGLECHVVFFLPSQSYGMLIRAADHLADWIPIKCHLLLPTNPFPTPYPGIDLPPLGDRMSSKAALQQLATLQTRLIDEKRKGTPSSILAIRYFLPMLESAIAIKDLSAAKRYREKISEKDIPKRALPNWWGLNSLLYFYMGDPDLVKVHAEKILAWARVNQNTYWEKTAYEFMGISEFKKQRFENAKEFFEKAIETKKDEANKLPLAGTYIFLGQVSAKQGRYQDAIEYYRKALEIQSEYGDRKSQAFTYHQTGLLAQSNRLYEDAESYYLKALEIEDEFEDLHLKPFTSLYLGLVCALRGKRKQSQLHFLTSLGILYKNGDAENMDFCLKCLSILWKKPRGYDMPAQIARIMGITIEEAEKLLLSNLQDLPSHTNNV